MCPVVWISPTTPSRRGSKWRSCFESLRSHIFGRHRPADHDSCESLLEPPTFETASIARQYNRALKVDTRINRKAVADQDEEHGMGRHYQI
ncbi:hypothetical protein EJ05DRAFT_480841 [Pseudovirgaria hyperparasitica]|uniref:Uncharacterized protein n=1 Tax=Pseudovirgaria hyperparasitica TaxID=470096 RepID=A0A6A6VUK2_9PEZI|nr:uncharacterized protein EJ05DRAFT_480841 [Pseudovirgaria hyperparasitica]KAF2752927.1 hypothetical protein EJ05DRAFT_480841 [Pseudovirgaria hyperparasitica]